MVIQESRTLGLYWRSPTGRAFAGFMLLLSVICVIAAFIYTLTLRLALHAYYTSAHSAALLVIVAAFIPAHHLLRVRRFLGCRPRPFTWLQCSLNIYYLLVMLAIALAYTLQGIYAINVNLDSVSAACWAWVAVIFLLYLTSLTIAAARGEWHSNYDMQIIRSSFVYQPAQDMPLRERKASNFKSRASFLRPNTKSAPCKGCSARFGHVFLGLFYFTFHIIFAIVLFLSAFQAYGVMDDHRRYRPEEDMYTVRVEGHRPVALFMQCRGNGSETIIIENGLGGTAYLAWHFIPRLLENHYKVCVHDRRNYGWSEGLQNDYIPTIWGEKPVPLTSREYFRDLIRQAGISTPFYYAGHNYGGPHMVAMALKYPEIIKGLIFLDSAKFSILDFGPAFETVSNFLPMGVVRLAMSAGFDFAKMADITPIYEMPPLLQEKTWATMRSGLYFEGLFRESLYLTKSNPIGEVRNLLESTNASISIPVLVVDAGEGSDWFPAEFFPSYNSSFYLVIRGATHTSIVYSTVHGNITAQYIHSFIQYQTGAITMEDFENDTKLSHVNRGYTISGRV